MFVTSVCAYLRVGGEQLGVCTIDFDVCVEREWCFVLLVMMVFRFGFNYRRNCACFPTSAEETCGQDKMRHFLREKACFKRNHFVASGNP